MNLESYIKKLGFEKNPFRHTNADKEKEYIDKYFVKPEYFDDLWGDPNDPVSAILYAPRGGGKTAQRLMIEKKSMEQGYEDLLVINYIEHDLSSFKSAEEITLSYHLEYLNRLLLIAFLDRIYRLESSEVADGFDSSERQYIYQLCKIYLYNTPSSFPKNAIKSIKTIEDKLIDFWKDFKEPVGEVGKSISKLFAVEVDISKIDVSREMRMSHRDNFNNIKDLLKKAGVNSIYILVDKVDEQELTGNDILASYQFISPLIKDLTLMETEGVSFKFFLWDELRPYVSEICRSDRIESYDYKWDFESLKLLLNKRLNVYSNNKIKDASEFFDRMGSWDVHNSRGLGRSILFAEKSPRDLLRICKRALSEQFRRNRGVNYISMTVLNFAIDKFCKEKCMELLKGSREDLMTLSKLNSVSFILKEVEIKAQILDEKSLAKYVSMLQSYGLLSIINKMIAKTGLVINEYAFSDIRIARMACSSLSLQDFIIKKVRDCKNKDCQSFAYRNFDEDLYKCIECNKILNKEKSELGISDRRRRILGDEVKYDEDGFEGKRVTGKKIDPIFNERVNNIDRLDEK